MTISEMIRKGIKYADGFSIDEHEGEDYVWTANAPVFKVDSPSGPLFEHFLSRVIEGINMADGRYDFEQGQSRILVFDNVTHNSNCCTLSKYESIDEAKEAAIVFVLEKE